MASTLCKVLLECMRRTPCVRLRAVHTHTHTHTHTQPVRHPLPETGPSGTAGTSQSGPRLGSSTSHAGGGQRESGAGEAPVEGHGPCPPAPARSRSPVPGSSEHGATAVGSTHPGEPALCRAGKRAGCTWGRPWAPSVAGQGSGPRPAANTCISPPVLASVSLSQGHRWHKKPSALQNKILLLLPREATLSSLKPTIPSLAIAEPPLCPAAGGWPC